MPSDKRQENYFDTTNIHHLGLAVSKLEETVRFFVDTLGWKEAGGKPEYPSKFVTNGIILLTLWQVKEPKAAIAFDRHNNVGLHHFAISVDSLEKLNELYETLKIMDNVTVEFGPELLGGGPRVHMMIYEPSGIRIEFIVPALG